MIPIPFIMRMFWAFLIFLLLWLVLAQSCMTMRQPDIKQKKNFQQEGIDLRTFTLEEDGHHLHYATTGNDSLPTIFFVHGTPGSWDAFEKYLKDKELLHKFRLVSIDRPGFGYSDFGVRNIYPLSRKS